MVKRSRHLPDGKTSVAAVQTEIDSSAQSHGYLQIALNFAHNMLTSVTTVTDRLLTQTSVKRRRFTRPRRRSPPTPLSRSPHQVNTIDGSHQRAAAPRQRSITTHQRPVSPADPRLKAKLLSPPASKVCFYLHLTCTTLQRSPDIATKTARLIITAVRNVTAVLHA